MMPLQFEPTVKTRAQRRVLKGEKKSAANKKTTDNKSEIKNIDQPQLSEKAPHPKAKSSLNLQPQHKKKKNTRYKTSSPIKLPANESANPDELVNFLQSVTPSESLSAGFSKVNTVYEKVAVKLSCDLLDLLYSPDENQSVKCMAQKYDVKINQNSKSVILCGNWMSLEALKTELEQVSNNFIVKDHIESTQDKTTIELYDKERNEFDEAKAIKSEPIDDLAILPTLPRKRKSKTFFDDDVPATSKIMLKKKQSIVIKQEEDYIKSGDIPGTKSKRKSKVKNFEKFDMGNNHEKAATPEIMRKNENSEQCLNNFTPQNGNVEEQTDQRTFEEIMEDFLSSINVNNHDNTQLSQKEDNDSLSDKNANNNDEKVVDIKDGCDNSNVIDMDDDSPLSTIEAPDTNVFEVDIDSNVATSDSGNDTNTLCSVCGFQSSSVYGLQTHMTNYHGKRTHECDICFRLFCTDSTRTRHRHSHFESEGILTQAGIVLHGLALERLKKEENLTGDLLQQIKNFTEEMLKKKIVSSACNGSVTETHAEKSETKDVRCDICGMCFIDEIRMRRHITREHENKKIKKKTESVKKQLGQMTSEEDRFPCPHCNVVCYRTQNFARHLKSHDKPDLFKCEFCSYSNKIKGELMRHQRNAHGERNFICDQCSYKCRSEAVLKSHMRQKHERRRAVVCEVCGATLVTKTSYKQHMLKFHGAMEDRAMRVMCQNCGRVLLSQKAFHKHWEKFHSDSTENPAEEKVVSEGVKIVEGGPFLCKYCNYSNNAAREVRRHIVRRHVDKTHQCDQCEGRFSRVMLLEKHIITHHGTAGKKPCEICGKEFQSEVYLKAHVDRVHNVKKVYQCDVCEKKFVSKRNYQAHVELHKPVDERKYKFQCGICEKKFRFRCNLKYHHLTHTGEKPHTCEICLMSFKTKTILQSHMIVHTDTRPFKCIFCDKSFKLEKYLNVHLQCHATEKVMCRSCGKMFVGSASIDRHVCKAIVGQVPGLEGEDAVSGNIELSQLDLKNVSHVVIEHPPQENFVTDVEMTNHNIDQMRVEHVILDNIDSMGLVQGPHITDTEVSSLDDAVSAIELQQPSNENLILETVDSMGNLDSDQIVLSVVSDEQGEQSLVAVNQDTMSLDGKQSIPAMEMYMCGICNKLFASQLDIQTHMEDHVQPDLDHVQPDLLPDHSVDIKHVGLSIEENL